MKKKIIIMLSLVMFLPLFAQAEMIKVGITQIVEHPALDANRQGIIDKLTELGYIEGKNIEYDIQIAQGNIATSNQIAKNFVGAKKDIIIAIATPTALAAANTTKRIPIIISAITDPVGAKLVKSLENPGTNVTGTTDLSPVAEQLQLLSKMGYSPKSIGIIYNSGEANSVTLVQLAKDAAKKMNIEIVEATVTNSSAVLLAAKSLIGKVDSIYIPTDNTVISALESVLKVANENKLPVITGDTDSVKRGALASYGLNYYKLGLQTGIIVEKIIKGANPATTPVESLKDLELFINLKTAKKIGFTFPADMIKNAEKVIK